MFKYLCSLSGSKHHRTMLLYISFFSNYWWLSTCGWFVLLDFSCYQSQVVQLRISYHLGPQFSRLRASRIFRCLRFFWTRNFRLGDSRRVKAKVNNLFFLFIFLTLVKLRATRIFRCLRFLRTRNFRLSDSWTVKAKVSNLFIFYLFFWFLSTFGHKHFIIK